ncbi:nucleotide exchange factor GrpE [Mycolicibacterium sp. P9-64]|uniref:nucleotide exchange factor GrpE n=1 Tax=Mycolicibacterium sp. P9-64 TaxID=2024612 RepID=UPI0011ED9079|nr:nucleotide exchange factor GrpE [Mycolicibacterium sp. P9-64]KAA0086735.1 nucleotide exchange factor GrpE [Mycolicibacterium sp. P9-64]
MTQEDSHEPVTFTDKRRIDPVTGEVREAAAGPAPSGSAPEASEPATESDEAVELKATLQRVKAEYDNYRKRSVRQEQAAAERAKAGVAAQLVPVLDDLERARNHGDLESGPLKSVADKLNTALENIGLVAFGAEGDPFDPSLHEAVQHEGDGSNPVIGTVMRQGYKIGDHILRHAMVGVIDTVPESDTVDETGRSDGENVQPNAESNE